MTSAEASIAPIPQWDILVFSAKESVHKTVYPATHEWLDFLDV